MDEARAALARLIVDRREDYAGLSRLLGRNPAYIQQYVKRGTPRRLAEQDRRTLARYFGVAEAALGGPDDSAPRIVAARAEPAAIRAADLVLVPAFAIGASAGPGALGEDSRPLPGLPFTPAQLHALGARDPAALSLIRVTGDSMQPTLDDGDDLLVDHADAADRLRDGLYVLRIDDALLVKRLSVRPTGLAILSDNAAYPPIEADRATLAIIGRAIWAGRRLR